jgi:tetrapyrrole methylase family protein/MazG family protein
MMQAVFHAVLKEETGAFDFNDVVSGVCTKLITRHTHVFGNDKAKDGESALSVWEKNKMVEKNQVTYGDSVNDVPKCFPAAMRAQKVGKKASMFDFPDAESVAVKVEEELAEVRSAVAQGDEAQIAEEMGDLLLSVVSLARKLHVNAEMALTAATDKCIARFAAVEQAIHAEGKSFEELSDEELDVFWQKCKKIIKK